MGHFTNAPTFAAWAATTAYSGLQIITPSPPNGYVYAEIGTPGNSGSTQPIWPTALGAEVSDAGLLWICIGTELGYLLNFWDAEQVGTINADLGGCWSPQSPITFAVTGGGYVQVNGPTQLTNGGELLIESGAVLEIGTGDFPRNGPTHLGRNRRLVTPALLALSDTNFGVAQNFAINGIESVASSLIYYAASADDSTVTSSTAPVQWQLQLDVHNGSTFEGVQLFYRANLGTPSARVVVVSSTGALTPVTTGDVNGYVTPPAVNVTETVQEWAIAADEGVVVSRDANTYLLQVVEDQTQTGYPFVLPVLTEVFAATTGPIDLAFAPGSIDGVAPPPGSRVLVKNQFNPAENGIYIYPGAGNLFPLAGGTPVPQWRANTAYSTGALVQPVGASPGHGLYFKCTTGGTSSTTTQPAWPLVSGATVTDPASGGTLVWTCEGTLTPYFYSPVIELRTYGLPQGAVIPVLNGTVNAGKNWQYVGTSIPASSIGTTPAVGWFLLAAQGNAYHGAESDFSNITTQEFQ